MVWIDAVERGAALTYEEAAPRIAAYLETLAKQHAIHQYLRGLAARHTVQGLEEFSNAR